MKCLNRTDMQYYIDNEYPIEKMAEINVHLLNCIPCNDLLIEATKEKNDLLKIIMCYDDKNTDIFIPEFKIPSQKSRFNKFHIIKIAASIIIILGLYFSIYETSKHKKPQSNQFRSEFQSIDNSDANKKWHKKQMEIIITDANGNIEESFISEN